MLLPDRPDLDPIGQPRDRELQRVMQSRSCAAFLEIGLNALDLAQPPLRRRRARVVLTQPSASLLGSEAQQLSVFIPRRDHGSPPRSVIPLRRTGTPAFWKASTPCC